jgi:hypothetical protein
VLARAYIVAAGKVAEKRQQSFTGLRQQMRRLQRMRQVAGAANGGSGGGGGVEVGNGIAKGARMRGEGEGDTKRMREVRVGLGVLT